MKAPIAVIGFVRKETLERVLHNISLAEDNSGRDIYVYLAPPRSENESYKTREVLRLVREFKRERLPNIVIVERDGNEGAGKNIRYAVTETLKKSGRAIIIEDDVLVSRTFLRYMDEALDLYEKDQRVWCINGYKSPYLRIPSSFRDDVYLAPRNMAWGWATWRDRWEKVDFEMKDWELFKSNPSQMARLDAAGQDMANMIQAQVDGKIDTWDVNCSFHMVNHSLWAVQPRLSLTKNIGFRTAGSVHCGESNFVIERQKYYDFSPRLIQDIPIPPRELFDRFRYAIMDFRFWGRVYRRLLREFYRFVPVNDLPQKSLSR